MRRSRALLTTIGAAMAVVLAVGGPPMSSAVAESDPLFIYRVSASSDAAAQRLVRAGYDVLEDRDGADLFVLGDARTGKNLRTDGFAPSVAETLRPATWKAPSTRLVPGAKAPALAPIDETYYGGYHTVVAQHAHLDKVAADHPTLATVVDFGDSYLKTVNAATGYDLKAICLTRKQAGDCVQSPTAPKPRFLLMTQIHAREIVTSDVAWRFIDHLANNYATNAQVRALLDTTEVWVVPVVNPDGVDVVQQGGNRPYLQRKNLNGTGCSNPPTGSNQKGVDLNRNTSFRWNTAGTSPATCSQTYPGRGPDSEAETKAINSLFRRLFADQRGPGATDPAPVTTRGAMISIHSYAGMNLFPWGYTNTRSPNDTRLRAIAQRMSSFNGYQFGQPGNILYNASGTSDDWTYGELGIASFTIELGSCNSFTPAYSCTTGEFNRNLPALMYVASIARAPYQP